MATSAAKMPGFRQRAGYRLYRSGCVPCPGVTVGIFAVVCGWVHGMYVITCSSIFTTQEVDCKMDEDDMSGQDEQKTRRKRADGDKMEAHGEQVYYVA